MRSARAGGQRGKGTGRTGRSLSCLFLRPDRVNSSRRHRGFTLAELVAVILIVSILAVSASAFFSRLTFETAGFADQTRALVAYAQKVAIAQRRPVFVALTATTVSACYDAGCATPIASPTGDALVRSAPSGVSLAPATTFSFNGLGQPSFGAPLTVTISGDATRSFVVEAETGYVR